MPKGKVDFSDDLKEHSRSPIFSRLEPVLKYLKDSKNVRFDWTSTKPISAPPKTSLLVGAKSFLKDPTDVYSPSTGDPESIRAIKDYFQRCEIPCTEEEIFISDGTFETIEQIFSHFKTGTRVLVATPTFGHYIKQCHVHNMNADTIEAKEEKHCKISPEELDRKLLLFKPKIFLFTNPVNPTGVSYTKEEIVALAQVLKKYNVLIISDEIFKDVYFNEVKKPYSIAAVEGMQGRTITLNGVSKSRGFAALRGSFGTAAKEYIELFEFNKITGFSVPIQKAMVESLKDTDENRQYLSDSISLYKENISHIKTQLTVFNKALTARYGCERTYGKLFLEPDATSLVLLDFNGLCGFSYNGKKLQTGLDIAIFLRDEAGVAMVPGEGFFINENKTVLRMSSSYNKEEITAGFEAMVKARSMLKPPPQYFFSHEGKSHTFLQNSYPTSKL